MATLDRQWRVSEMKVSHLIKIVVALLLLIAGVFAAFYFSVVSTVQVKSNPSGTHKAKLFRYDGIDVNFRVRIDGDGDYYSPDFAPVEYDFREQIIWDKTGNILVLEVAGKRIFAYDAQQKRQLSNSELMAVEYVPFSEFHFEGKLPEVNSN